MTLTTHNGMREHKKECYDSEFRGGQHAQKLVDEFLYLD